MEPWFTPPIVIPAAIVVIIVALAINLTFASVPLGEASIGAQPPHLSDGERT